MESLLKTSLSVRQESRVKVNGYPIKGKIINYAFDKLDIPGPFEEYAEENLYEFLDKFDTVVKPSIDD